MKRRASARLEFVGTVERSRQGTPQIATGLLRRTPIFATKRDLHALGGEKFGPVDRHLTG